MLKSIRANNLKKVRNILNKLESLTNRVLATKVLRIANLHVYMLKKKQ